jgi:hypothetical protein
MSNQGPNVVVLTGSRKEMGVSYGKLLEHKLKAVYQILTDYYVGEKNISEDRLARKADLFFEKYPYSYQMFLKGVAEGANITLDQAKILNGMETLNSLLTEKSDLAACAFISIPPEKSFSGTNLVGRNYDFFPPFDKCSEYLTVTVLKETDHVPTAFIGFAGQIYCPTCVNQNGLFVEFNNGMPSGGFYTDHSRESLLINLLESLQNSATMDQLDKQLSALNSDYSLVVNTVNQTHAKSFEYSSTHGMKSSNFTNNEIVSSTNFFTNPTWSFEVPTNEACWLGHTRRENLLSLAQSDSNISIDDLKQMLGLNIENGGGSWAYTLYQLIFDTSSLALMVKMPSISDVWHEIDLMSLFEKQDVEIDSAGQSSDLEQ